MEPIFPQFAVRQAPDTGGNSYATPTASEDDLAATMAYMDPESAELVARAADRLRSTNEPFPF